MPGSLLLRSRLSLCTCCGKSSDNFACVANAGQEDEDGDAIGDACDTGSKCDPCSEPGATGGDTDLDGHCNGLDNCESIGNPDQIDQDHDGFGDPCDLTPADPTLANDMTSQTDIVTVIADDGETYLETRDGTLSIRIPEEAASPQTTLSLVCQELNLELGDLRVDGESDGELRAVHLGVGRGYRWRWNVRRGKGQHIPIRTLTGNAYLARFARSSY